MIIIRTSPEPEKSFTFALSEQVVEVVKPAGLTAWRR
jgi:hypothetical protein